MKNAAWTTIRSNDTRALIDFLCEAFGFEEQFVVLTDDGRKIQHAQLVWPLGGGVMLGDTGIHDSDLEQPLGGAAVYLVTENPGELYKRAVKAKAKNLRKPENQNYGSRDFAANNLGGNVWSFRTYSGEGSY